MPGLDQLDETRRDAAVERLNKRADFQTHVIAYVLVNAFLVVIWFMTDSAFFWPVFPLAGWGIGVFFHAMDTFRRPPSEARIQREMKRLK